MLCPGCINYQTMSNKFQNKYRILSARIKKTGIMAGMLPVLKPCAQKTVTIFWRN
jgi:hypothetical protein